MSEQSMQLDPAKQIVELGSQSAKANLGRSYREAGDEADSVLQEVVAKISSVHSDSPALEDQLGFDSWAQNMAATIVDFATQTPLCIAVVGPWGSGKSTFLRLIQRRIRESRRGELLTVWLDPAKATRPADVIHLYAAETRSEATKLARQLVELPQRSPFYSEGGSAIPPYLAKQAKQDADEWIRTWQGRQTDHLEWNTDVFIQMLREIRRGLLGRQGLGRIVLFIDDVDRCDPSVVIEILRIHRSLLSEWGIVLLYAMDYDLVAEIVGRHHAPQHGEWSVPDAREHGKWYLEKFFGHKIRPPDADEHRVSTWVAQLLGSLNVPDQIGLAIWTELGANPRRFKYFANMCRDVYTALEAAKTTLNSGAIEPSSFWRPLLDLSSEDSAILLSKTIAIALGWPQVYEVARSIDPSALVSIEQATTNKLPVPKVHSGRVIQGSADATLAKLLATSPFYAQSDLSVLDSLVKAIEPFLGVPRFQRSLPDLLDEVRSNQSVDGASREAKQTIVGEDITQVREIVRQWQSMHQVGEHLGRILALVPPLRGVEIFKKQGFRPQTRDLVAGARSAFFANQAELGAWLCAAASVAPDTDLSVFDAIDGILRQANFDDLLGDILPVGVARMSIKSEANLLRRLLVRLQSRSNDPKTRMQGVEASLAMLGVTLVSLREGTVKLQSDLDYNSFVAATDSLQNADLYSEELELARSGIAAKRQVLNAGLVRNLARALSHNGQMDQARRVYEAAILLESTDSSSADWYARLLERALGGRWTYDQALRRGRLTSLIALLRDPLNPDLWPKAGSWIAMTSGGKEAMPWFERAIEIEPENPIHRTALARLIEIDDGIMASQEVYAKDFVPHPDVEGMLSVARASEEAFIRLVIAEGPIEDNGVMLFDPKRLPKWICESHPGFCAQEGDLS